MTAAQAIWLILAFGAGVAVAFAWIWPRLSEARTKTQYIESLLTRMQMEAAEHRGYAVEMRQLFEDAIDSYPHPIIVTDRDRVILFANRAAVEMARMPRPRIIGRVAATVIQDYDTTLLLMEAARTGERQDQTFQRATTGQTWHVTISPVRPVVGTESDSLPAPETGDPALPTYLILTVQDLTELRRLEAVRRDFVAHVSHELRTPLAALKLLAETLTQALDNDPASVRRFAARMSGEIDHLSQMVAELLVLSRLDSGHMQIEREPTDLGGLVETVVDRMRPLAEERNIILSASIPTDLPLVNVDGRRTSEVLVNLIHNALKYTPAGGNISIGASLVLEVNGAGAAETDQGTQPVLPVDSSQMVAVRVRDTGIGISQDDLPHVFERFFKVDRARTRTQVEGVPDQPGADGDAQTRAAAGTGLGLAIAKHLIELQGGRIWAESRLGHGSTFVFTVPVAHDSERQEDQAAPPLNTTQATEQ